MSSFSYYSPLNSMWSSAFNPSSTSTATAKTFYQFNIEVINNYSNKSFYNYYAVIPRGTISFYLNKDHLLLFYFNNFINFYPKKRIFLIYLKTVFYSSFIGSFCLNIIFRYFHLNSH